MITIYDSLTKKIIPLPKRRPLRLFVCGPTVYDNPHIGNARTFMVFDIFVRYLRSRGIEVEYLENITDIDDKIIKKATTNKSWREIALEYERVFKQNMKNLNISSVSKYAKATDHVSEIIKQIITLIAKGNAYLIPDDGWYFDISTFPHYGELAGRTVQQAEDAVSRIDESSNKKNKGDFALWKFPALNPHQEPQISNKSEARKFKLDKNKKFRRKDFGAEPAWNTPLGWGRPGWHIEDTAITEHYFGPQYDIHGGGVDLKFPHHEAEIAQQESASGKRPFVKIWMHPGHLLVKGAKMAKSKGNFITINQLLKESSADAFRMMLIQNHYRTPLDYSPDAMLQAEKNLYSFMTLIGKLSLISKAKTKVASQHRKVSYQSHEKKLHASMSKDLGTPGALASLFELMNDVQKDIWSIDPRDAKSIKNFLLETFKILGFKNMEFKMPKKIEGLAKDRLVAKKNKQFIHSDALREKIEELGYRVEDNLIGQFVFPSFEKIHKHKS